MNTVPHFVILALVALLAFSELSGQQRVIEGKVTTFETIPLMMARVEVKSSNKVVYTDSLGAFIVSCAPKDILKITAAGFTTRKVRIRENTKIALVNMILSPRPDSRQLAVGYGHVLDEEKLYAISNVNQGDMDFGKYSSIYDIIDAQFPSVQIYENGELVIRGAPSMDGSNAALLIIDGVQVDEFIFGNINTVSIASINVLKDASTAIYGSRGANGAVLVTTRRGDSPPRK